MDVNVKTVWYSFLYTKCSLYFRPYDVGVLAVNWRLASHSTNTQPTTHYLQPTTPNSPQVDHWALGERELMCQWRVETRNAAMCGGRRELKTSGMMALYLWTSEDGLAPSVEPRSKPSTWSILRSAVDRPDPPLLPPSQTPPTTTATAAAATAATVPTPSSCKKPAALSSSVLSVSRGPSSSSFSVVETANGGGGAVSYTHLTLPTICSV